MGCPGDTRQCSQHFEAASSIGRLHHDPAGNPILSTASLRTDETTHTGARRGRFLGFVLVSAMVICALALLRSHFGGGDEERQRESSGAETASAEPDERATTEAPAPAAQSDEAQAA